MNTKDSGVLTKIVPRIAMSAESDAAAIAASPLLRMDNVLKQVLHPYAKAHRKQTRIPSKKTDAAIKLLLQEKGCH
jgi:hypothetical protein